MRLFTLKTDEYRKQAHLFKWKLIRLLIFTPSFAFGVFLTSGNVVSAQILSPASISSLQPGDTGPRVIALQEQLQLQGYFVEADGVYGSETENAVRSFQISQGIVADGIYGPETEAALFGTTTTLTATTTPTTTIVTTTDSTFVTTSDSTFVTSPSDFGPYLNVPPGSRSVTLGDRGSDVLELQRLLNERGFNAGVEDGAFGDSTVIAVRNFQASQGINVDGVCGPMTWEALGVPYTGDGNIYYPPTTYPPTYPPTTSSGLTPLITILEGGRYVVVVPGSDPEKLETIRRSTGRAYVTRSGRGTFMTPGGYDSHSEARGIELRLRGEMLDARVEYFNSRLD